MDKALIATMATFFLLFLVLIPSIDVTPKAGEQMITAPSEIEEIKEPVFKVEALKLSTEELVKVTGNELANCKVEKYSFAALGQGLELYRAVCGGLPHNVEVTFFTKDGDGIKIVDDVVRLFGRIDTEEKAVEYVKFLMSSSGFGQSAVDIYDETRTGEARGCTVLERAGEYNVAHKTDEAYNVQVIIDNYFSNDRFLERKYTVDSNGKAEVLHEKVLVRCRLAPEV